MTMKSIESVVRELQQTVLTLVNKVGTLESKIIEQSAIIIKLSSANDNPSTRKSVGPSATTLTPSGSTTSAPIQRPVRSARVQASAAIAQLASATNKRRNVQVNTKLRPSFGASPNDRSAGTASDSNEKTCPTSTASETIVPDATMHTPPNPMGTVDDDHTESQWKLVNRRRGRKQQLPVIVGTADTTNNELQAADRRRHIQAWSFKPETSASTVLCFLNKITKSEFTVEKRDIKSDRHSSFIIGMPEKVFEQVTQPTAWPAGVRFTEWFLYRPRARRGSCEGTGADAGGERDTGITAAGSSSSTGSRG